MSVGTVEVVPQFVGTDHEVPVGGLLHHGEIDPGADVAGNGEVEGVVAEHSKPGNAPAESCAGHEVGGDASIGDVANPGRLEFIKQVHAIAARFLGSPGVIPQGRDIEVGVGQNRVGLGFIAITDKTPKGRYIGVAAFRSLNML